MSRVTIYKCDQCSKEALAYAAYSWCFIFIPDDPGNEYFNFCEEKCLKEWAEQKLPIHRRALGVGAEK